MKRGDIILFDWGDTPHSSKPVPPPTNPAQRIEWLRDRKDWFDEWPPEDVEFLFEELDRRKALIDEAIPLVDEGSHNPYFEKEGIAWLVKVRGTP